MKLKPSINEDLLTSSLNVKIIDEQGTSRDSKLGSKIHKKSKGQLSSFLHCTILIL